MEKLNLKKKFVYAENLKSMDMKSTEKNDGMKKLYNILHQRNLTFNSIFP